MNSRERVRAVLNHTLPDRIPNGLGGCETAGLHIVAYDKLKSLFGQNDTPTRIDTFMTNAVFEEPVIRSMEGDIILLDSPNMSKARLRGDVADQWHEQTIWGTTYSAPITEFFTEQPDGSFCWNHRICPKGGYYFDKKTTTDLLADIKIPDPDDFHPTDTIDEKILRHLEEQAKRLYEETDLSICLGESIRDLQVAPAGGTVGTMVLMMEEPDVMKAFLQKCVDASLKQIEQLEQAVGKYVDILCVAHDFGDNRGVTIGDSLWREIYKPYYAQWFSGWKKRTNMKINLHSCGAISSIMGDLIECGADILNPIQTSAANMDAETLKKAYGDKVIFWGGAYDAQLIPTTASYEDVYNTVFRNIKILGNGGNFIFSGVHNLPATLPEHHIKAMLDALKDARNYN